MRIIIISILAMYFLASCDEKTSDSHSCGDGIVDTGEDCDGINLAGATCVSLNYSGGELSCNETCQFVVSSCEDEWSCGDSEIQHEHETCDGQELSGETCLSLGLGEGVLQCKLDCSAYDISGCELNPCGDGIIDADYGEDCDTGDLNGQSCELLGYISGTLSCNSDCTLNTEACITETTLVVENNTPYVFPPNGTEGYFDIATSQYISSARLMSLEVIESGGSYTLRDNCTNFNQNIYDAYRYNGSTYTSGQLVVQDSVAYMCTAFATTTAPPSPDWEVKTLEKRYFFSFNQSASQGYSAEQMQTGINVDGWKGKEVRVFMAYFPTTGELSYLSPTSQQIYIGGVQSTDSFAGGTYYYRHPQQLIVDSDRVPRWNEYITTDFNIPTGKYVVIDAKNQEEVSTTTSYGDLGVFSRLSSTPGKKYLFVGDDWLTDIGHPAAYAGGDFASWWSNYKAARGGLAGGTAGIKAQFADRVTNRAASIGATYIMINNELWSYWDEEFGNVIKQCYDQHHAASSAILSAWTDNLVAPEFNLDKARAYQDYIDTRPYEQFAADNTRFFKLTPSTNYKYSLDVNQIGSYFTDRNPNNLAKLIGQALMSNKYNLPHKNIATIWNVVETLKQPLFFYQELYQGRPILSRTKDFVSPHLLRNYAAAACFFGDGVHMWHNGYTISNDAEHYFEPSRYVNGEGQLYYMDVPFVNGEPGDYKVVSPLAPNNAVPWSKENNIDWLINGVWAVYKNPIFADINAKVAEVSLDGGATWRTGESAFVIGAAVDNEPFAAFKQVGTEYLVFAIDFDGTTVKDIKVRMEGVVKDIRLMGDNVSIVKF